MAPKFNVMLGFLIFAFCASASAQEKETIVSGETGEALAMLQERFASLSGSLGKMSVPPQLSGTLSLPPRMEGKINLPGGSGNLTPSHQEGEK